MNVSQQTPPPASYDDEIDLRELFRVLWAGKWLIGSITFVAAVVAVIVALMLPNIYRAEALLAPNDKEGSAGLSALAAQYGGLASLAGINLGGGSTDEIGISLEILRSRKFVSEFIERHDILVPLVAATDWNSETRELIIDSRAYDVESGKWIREVSAPKMTVPSSQEAYKVFTSMLSIGQDKKTGLVTIAVEHYSPLVAKRWVDWLVDDINSTTMQHDVAQAEQAIDYLNEQINATSLADLQAVFFKLIEEQTKTVMLAKVSPEYMFRTLDPAVAPELKTKPKRALIAVLGTILGGMFGVVVLAFKNTIVSRREKSSVNH